MDRRGGGSIYIYIDVYIHIQVCNTHICMCVYLYIYICICTAVFQPVSGMGCRKAVYLCAASQLDTSKLDSLPPTTLYGVVLNGLYDVSEGRALFF